MVGDGDEVAGLGRRLDAEEMTVRTARERILEEL
jgi:hypothetical protein